MSDGCAATTARSAPRPAGAEDDLGAGLPGDEHAGGEVPRREVKLPERVDLPGRDVAQVKRGAAAAADVAHAAEERVRTRPRTGAARTRTRTPWRRAPWQTAGYAHAGPDGRRRPRRPPRRPGTSGPSSSPAPRRPGLAVDLDRDGDRVGRVAVDVVGRPVQRVDDPAHPARPVARRALFSEDGVVRPLVAQALDDEALRGPVHLADEVGRRRLGLDAQRLPPAFGVDAPRLQREVARQGEQLAQVWRGGGERVVTRSRGSLSRAAVPCRSVQSPRGLYQGRCCLANARTGPGLEWSRGAEHSNWRPAPGGLWQSGWTIAVRCTTSSTSPRTSRSSRPTRSATSSRPTAGASSCGSRRPRGAVHALPARVIARAPAKRGDLSFRRVAAPGFELYLEGTQRLWPRMLEFALRRKRRIEAYWNGMGWVA